MLRGVFQLAKLTLATDGRRVGLHGARFGLAATFYLAVCYYQASFRTSAAGLQLFQSQLQITAFFLSMTAVFGFSQSITEEKEEETLALMRLADVSPLAVILGKASSMFCDAAMLIVIQFPFTIVAITLGGISWPQVVAAYVALAAYLWMLVFVALLASVTEPTGTIAARTTAIVVGAYFLIPVMFSKWISVSLAAMPVRIIDRISLPLRLVEVTDSAFNGSPWCAAVAFGLIAGLSSLMISCLTFDRFAFVDSNSEAPLRLATTHRTSRRSWSKPIIWREYTFVSGGHSWTIVRMMLPVGFFVFSFLYWNLGLGVAEVGFPLAWASIACGVFGVLDGSWSACRLIRDEIRYRTWSSLIQTPHALKTLILQKYLGCALGLAPTIAAPFLLIAAMLRFHEHVRDSTLAVEISVGTLVFGITAFGYLHLLVLLSLYFGWKATPIALTICLSAVVIYSHNINFNTAPSTRCGWYLLTGLAIMLMMFWFQRLIVKRLNQLAETA